MGSSEILLPLSMLNVCQRVQWTDQSEIIRQVQELFVCCSVAMRSTVGSNRQTVLAIHHKIAPASNGTAVNAVLSTQTDAFTLGRRA